jgi:hypothetical protein
MGTFLSTVISIGLVYGGIAGIEFAMGRYATPGARSADRAPTPSPTPSSGIPEPCGDDAARSRGSIGPGVYSRAGPTALN